MKMFYLNSFTKNKLFIIYIYKLNLLIPAYKLISFRDKICDLHFLDIHNLNRIKIDVDLI